MTDAPTAPLASGIPTERWRPSPVRAMVERLATPAIYLINRPSMQPLARLIHEFALRCNGIGNNVEGPSGLARSEERFLRQALAQFAEGVVLDVGANVGGYARFVRELAPRARLIAFEPHPRTFAALRAVAERDGFEAIHAAMSDAPGTTTLYDFPDNDGSTQASLDPNVIFLHGGQQPVAHPVECLTLDGFAEARGIERIHLLKIDTEGFDLNVMRGARRLLAERRIGLIQFEFIGSNIARKVSVRDFLEVLAEPGYEVARLCMNGQPAPLGPYSPKFHEVFLRHNLVAYPKGGLEGR
ncbi:FkbM family methyltransferase [Roseococcus sp. DSY-14]|uniref:FkbM family methyltransferase n=1 Tax=Roseococcus sp. DSY-14 TaxID=3369650 RepID=UPI00387B2F8F